MKGIGRQHGKVTFCDFLRRPVLIHCQLPCFLSTVASWVSSKSPYGNGSLPYAPYTPAWKEWFNEENGGRFHMIVKEDAGNLIRAVALDGQPEYPRTTAAVSSSISQWCLFCGSFLYPQIVQLVVGLPDSPLTLRLYNFLRKNIVQDSLVYNQFANKIYKGK